MHVEYAARMQYRFALNYGDGLYRKGYSYYNIITGTKFLYPTIFETISALARKFIDAVDTFRLAVFIALDIESFFHNLTLVNVDAIKQNRYV